MRRTVAKSKGLPEHFQRITTYRELEQFAEAFAKGSLSLLGVFGSGGLGKSRTIRQALGDRVCWIDGNVSPFGIYMLAYEHRNQPIVLDDVDGLYRDRNGVRLLKALCQTKQEKTLCWETDAKTLEDRGIPRHFPTTSHVAIIANQWKSLNADVAALEDRGHFLFFDPLAAEVHRQAGTWFWDQEVFDFVAEQLHLMENHSLRTYWRTAELKEAKMDWKASILGRCLSGAALEVAKLKSNPNFGSEKERVQAFVESGWGSRASYFNHARRTQPQMEIPSIKLSQTTPPWRMKIQSEVQSEPPSRNGQVQNC